MVPDSSVHDEPYFVRYYGALSYPLASAGGAVGFRPPQAGAIHGLAAHFSQSREPAIVTMPTGSGKTAVLVAAAFALRAKRVLVLTPSRLVREQVAEEFESLAVLRRINAIGRIPSPKVISVRNRLTSEEAWLEVSGNDVVVATPLTVSPSIQGVARPPQQLFDLVLVDEAHHSPAASWQALLDEFPSAHRALFTATPFRRDRREIKGRFVYTYELRDAYHDGVFSKIDYEPVHETIDLVGDAAIAAAAAAVLKRDRSAGFKHVLMVRVDSQQRAKALEPVYRDAGLPLPVLTSSHSLKHAKQIIDNIRKGQIDGLICVNMLGEGFDLPELKVAAIHTPHKSLAATLQFIGRFARSSQEKVGSATFLAIPSDIEIESERLFEADATWQHIVGSLSAAAVAEEITTKEMLATFARSPVPSALNYDVSLYAIRPGYHAKVYRVSGGVDLKARLQFPSGQEIVIRDFSNDYRATIIVTREIAPPDWLGSDQFANTTHELFVVHYHEKSGLLFICASERAETMYDRIARQLCKSHMPLSMARLSRVLLELNNPQFFNIGLRNRVQATGLESYRIIAGSEVDQAVQASDGRLFSQGHVFGKGTDNGVKTTIGLSSSSRVWSATKSRIPRLIEWCDRLADKIETDAVVRTNSGLDHVSPGEELRSLPDDLAAVDWDIDAYIEAPTVVHFGEELRTPVLLLDVETRLSRGSRTEKAVSIDLVLDGTTATVVFSLETDQQFVSRSTNEPEVFLERRGQRLSIVDYLNARPLAFYTANLSFFSGATLIPAADADFQAFDPRAIESIDWSSEGVDYTCEYDDLIRGLPSSGLCSIHTFLEKRLLASGSDIVFYDHGTGELADFITVTRQTGTPMALVSFYHCKSAPQIGGDRVEDAYEVVGQCVKSVHWKSLAKLREKVLHRAETRPGRSRFLRGSIELVEELLADSRRALTVFEAVIVQPGFSRSNLSPKLGNILAASGDYLRRAGFFPLRVLGS